jgi:hypothetical protein
MKFNIEFTNTIASLAWAFVVFTLVGMSIANRSKRGK